MHSPVMRKHWWNWTAVPFCAASPHTAHSISSVFPFQRLFPPGLCAAGAAHPFEPVLFPGGTAGSWLPSLCRAAWKTETSHDKKDTPFHFRYGGVLHAAKNPFTMDTIEQPEMLQFFEKFFRFVGMHKVMTSICAYRTISVFQSRFEKKRSIFRRFML